MAKSPDPQPYASMSPMRVVNSLPGVAAACILAGATVLSPAAHAQQNVFKSPALPNSVEVRPPAKEFNKFSPNANNAQTVFTPNTSTQGGLKFGQDTLQQVTPQPAHIMQQVPNPGMFGIADECALVDFTDEQLVALKKLVVRQLTAQGGDVQGFSSNDPPNCRRKQMIYYMKSVVLVTR